MSGQTVKYLTIVAGAIALAAVALTVAWIVFLLLWKTLNVLRPFRILGGRYALSNITDPPGFVGIGEIVRSRVGDEIHFARKGARTFQNVDGPDALVPSQVPPLPDDLKGLAPLINLLLRRDRFVVTIIALRPVRGMVALHVRLSRSTGRLLESRRFTERIDEMEDAAQAYSGAAMLAGSWLAFMLEQYARSRFARNPRLELLGTGSWLSYSWLCRGLRHSESVGDSIAWYNAALRVDHRNIGALIALGRQMVMGSDASERDKMNKGIEHLKFAREQLGSSPRLGMSTIFRVEYPSARANPQWYQATYTLAVAYRNYYAAFFDAADPCPVEYLTEAVRLGAELARATAATRLTLASNWRRWAIKANRREDLHKAFRREDSDLASIVAVSKACLEMQQSWNDEPALPLPGWEPADKTALWKLLSRIDPDHLESLPPAANLRMAQECGSAPGSNQKCHLTPKTRYNSACYYACIHDFEKALIELRHVFAHMSPKPKGGTENVNYPSRDLFIDWANKDPALRQLRDVKELEFARIINGASAQFGQRKGNGASADRPAAQSLALKSTGPVVITF
jgi:hypothetical protein